MRRCRPSPRLAAALVGLVVLSTSEWAWCDAPPNPVEALGDDIAAAFTGTNLIYYGAAIASLAALSPTGGDHAVRVGVQEHFAAPAWGDAAYYTGYLLPPLLAPALYVGGLVSRDHSLAGAGSAAILALGLTVTTTVILKVGTGRPFPQHGEAPDAPGRLDHPEYAREFAPFGFAGRYAWPSGHTSAAFAMAAALTAHAQDSIWVPLTAYPLAVGIGAGMIVGDHHWASDVLAGAAIGQAIGWSVGSSFRERHRCGQADTSCAASDQEAPSWVIVPWLGDARGFAVVGTLW